MRSSSALISHRRNPTSAAIAALTCACATYVATGFSGTITSLRSGPAPLMAAPTNGGGAIFVVGRSAEARLKGRATFANAQQATNGQPADRPRTEALARRAA